MTEVHKIVMMVVDHDKLGSGAVKETVENTRYPNRCIRPHVVELDTRQVEWSDDHPLNQDAGFEEFRRIFRSQSSDNLAAGLDRLHRCIIHDARDWALLPRDALTWALVVGWDDESWLEIQRRHGWSNAAVVDLKIEHAAISAAKRKHRRD